MKPIVIIAISVACSVIVVIAILSIVGVNFVETSLTERSIVEKPEELRLSSGEKIGTEKFVIIHQVLLETAFMGEEMGWRYVIKNYRDDPAYNEECTRLWYMMHDVSPKERLSDEEIREILSVWHQACHNAIIKER